MIKDARQAALRLLDASANRALEGLRVCEEIVRLSWESPKLYKACRSLRHGVAEAVRRLPVSLRERLTARDSRADVGRSSASGAVETLERLVLINLQRTKEALRTLEECSRVVASHRAADFQRLRFQTYDLERSLVLHVASLRDRRRRRRPRT